MYLISLKEYKSINKKVKIDGYGIFAQKYYLQLYSLYIELIIKFIKNKTNIKKYDKILKDLNINIKDKNNVYNKITKKYLNYFYINNKFYINKIDDSDLMYLNNKLLKEDYRLDTRCKKIITDSLQSTLGKSKLHIKLNICFKDSKKKIIKEIIKDLNNELKNTLNIKIRITI